MELKLSQSSLPTAIFNQSSFLPKHFALLAKRWKLDIQRITWKGQGMSKKILVHVVKEGETLTSISKLYGVPVLEIASSNEEIADVDLVFEGQQLKIPSVADCAQVCHFEGYRLHEHQSPNRSPRLGFHIRQWNQIFTMPSFYQFPDAKTAGSFYVLVPLVAFCIGCIMGAFQIILAKNSRHRAAKKLGVHHHTSNSARWKTALSDLRDPDSLDAESAPDSDPSSDEKEQLHFEDVSRAYTKLEGDYKKFLSQCGMSNYGYWRGGSPQ